MCRHTEVTLGWEGFGVAVQAGAVRTGLISVDSLVAGNTNYTQLSIRILACFAKERADVALGIIHIGSDLANTSGVDLHCRRMANAGVVVLEDSQGKQVALGTPILGAC